MIHARKLDQACPKCGVKGAFGALFIKGDAVIRGCSVCKSTEALPLPPLRKQILYLDQCFLSAAFRERVPQYVNAIRRIQKLASRQLLVCPFSDIHETETHQWANDQQQQLWQFIKQTALGIRFAHKVAIRHSQIFAAFNAWLEGQPFPTVSLMQAFHENPSRWDDMVWIDVRRPVMDAEEVRTSKRNAALAMVKQFTVWRDTSRTFEQDYQEEAHGYASIFLPAYFEWARSLSQPAISIGDILGSPEAQTVSHLLLNFKAASRVDALIAVDSFLKSNHFRRVPYVDASCRLMSALRRALREGELQAPDRAYDAMLGFGFDMDVVSVFAPYVDAVIIDKQMHRWISSRECELPQIYKFKVFSAADWSGFFSFLDEVEAAEPADHEQWLKVAYG